MTENAEAITSPTHFLRRPTLGAEPVAITAAEFEQIAEAWDGLIQASMIEEKFIMMLDNFIEFEDALHAVTLRWAVYLHAESSEFRDATFLINRRLNNLLSTCRMYLDHTSHALSEVFGSESTTPGRFNAARNREYDNTIGYMMAEALRNHLQHHSLAVHDMALPGRWHEQDGERHRYHGIEPRLRRDDLRQNKAVPQRARDHLEGLGEKVCITPWVREYVEGLSRIHREAQFAIEEELKKWLATLTEALERGKAERGESPSGYMAVRIGDTGREVHIVPDLMERYQVQRRRTANAGHVTRVVITSAVKP